MTTPCRLVVVLTVLICPASLARAVVLSDLLVDQLLADDGAADDRFGYSVAVSGNLAVVGALSDDDPAGNSGSAYIFENGPAGWTQVTKLLPNDGEPWSGFGVSVAMDGNTVVIGSSSRWSDVYERGAAYIFQDAGAGWSQVAKLVSEEDPNNPTPGYSFGRRVAISGNTAVVGSPYEHTGDYTDGEVGAAYVYEDNGAGWTRTARLLPDDVNAYYDRFGWSVGVSGDTVMVGAPADYLIKKNAEDDQQVPQNSVYFFERDESGWAKTDKLSFEAMGFIGEFGSALDIDGNRAIVGDYYWQFEDIGRSHILENNGDGWEIVDTLMANDPLVYDNFGGNVALSGSTALVADSDAGIVYLFEKTDAGWVETDQLFSIGQGEFPAFFKIPLDIDSGTAMVGNALVSPLPDFPGIVHVFEVPAIPEPSSLLLLLAAACCALIWRRKR